MNILIITSFFPPDRAIASVRPYMFAKYLRQMGHEVTVLYPGDGSRPQDTSLAFCDLDIKVYTYLKRVEPNIEGVEANQTPGEKRKLAFLPEEIRNVLKPIYHKIIRPFRYVRYIADSKKRFKYQRICMDSFQAQHFDVVFATYGNLENIYAGKYAAQKFGSKLLFDFRDPIAQRTEHSWWEYKIFKSIQKNAVQAADICTIVSEDTRKQYVKDTDTKVITLYNGYDTAGMPKVSISDDGILRFCYTGQMYGNNRSSSSLFRTIRCLADEGKVDLSNIRYEHAGPDFEMLLKQAEPYGVEQILVDHGSVTREQAAILQNNSDIFVVMSWNTEYEKGVLTGKFYEGIRAKKPILSLVTGNVPGSELSMLNTKFNYGFCYEECSSNREFEALCHWIEQAYLAKQQNTKVPYAPKEELFTTFHYANLSKQLEQICKDLIS